MSGFYPAISSLGKNASGQPTLIEELWEFLSDKYFTLDIAQYDNLNLSLGNGGVINLSWAIMAFCFGMVLAAIFGVYEKRGLGEFVRKLLFEECYTPESAKTLYQLGYRKNAAVRGALRRGSLSKVVVCVQKEQYDKQIAQKRAEYEQYATKDSPPFKSIPYKINYETDTFYIPKDASYAAEMRYNKRGSGVGAVLISIVAALVLTLFIIFILPDVLQLLDNFVGMMSPQANYH